MGRYFLCRISFSIHAYNRAMKKTKKIPEERQIALILKDLDEKQLMQMKQIIIAAICLVNKHQEKLPSFQGNSVMN